jgi:SAM-dependent methyltransferase
MNKCLEFFVSRLNTTGTVIELGTKRWGKNPTHHVQYWPEAKHIGVDYIAGQDVDIVADAMKLSEVFDENSIDAVFSASTFEHIENPFLAANEILKVLKPGGVFFIQTHHTFPSHSFPHDYWRFSKEALLTLFKDAGELMADYEYPCQIIPPESITNWNSSAPAFLNVVLSGVKK